MASVLTQLFYDSTKAAIGSVMHKQLYSNKTLFIKIEGTVGMVEYLPSKLKGFNPSHSPPNNATKK
jgi:hypothetical protein